MYYFTFYFIDPYIKDVFPLIWSTNAGTQSVDDIKDVSLKLVLDAGTIGFTPDPWWS